MDGLSRAAGSGVPIRFNGEMLIIPAMTYRDIGTIEQYLLSGRPSPIESAKQVMLGLGEMLDAETREKLIERAYQDGKKMNTVSEDEFNTFLNSRQGTAFIIWVLLDKQYPKRFKLEDIQEVIMQMVKADFEALKRAQEQAAGMDDLGNSTGPVPTVAGPEQSQLGVNTSGPSAKPTT